MVTGEYGFLSADGVYRTTVYTSSPQTGYVVVAQTREERGRQEEQERKEVFDFNYTTQDNLVTNQGHHHEVSSVTTYVIRLTLVIPRAEVTETHHRQAGTGGMVLMVTGEWLLILLIVLATILL